jgi:hypothetical protein
MIISELVGDLRGRRPVQVLVELAYDADEDPLAVRMTFKAPNEEDVVWLIGRDLLRDGAFGGGVAGHGDVRFRVDVSDDALVVCLRSHEGHAHVALPLEGVRDFVQDTAEEAAAAAGRIESLIDAGIEGLLNG